MVREGDSGSVPRSRRAHDTLVGRHDEVHSPLGGSEKSRRALTPTAAPTSSADTPRADARRPTVSATHAGSLRLPRCGTGARYGESDSANNRSFGTKRRSASSVQFLNVMMPLKETYQPASSAAFARV